MKTLAIWRNSPRLYYPPRSWFFTTDICILYILFLLYKSNKTIWIFKENFLTRETTRWTSKTCITQIGCLPVYNPWQPEVYWKFVFFFHSGSVIILSIPEVMLLFSTKQSFIIIKKDKLREGQNHSKNVDNSIEYTFTR
jgi:hypothetical protein